jgi:hypothetical protein
LELQTGIGQAVIARKYKAMGELKVSDRVHQIATIQRSHKMDYGTYEYVAI